MTTTLTTAGDPAGRKVIPSYATKENVQIGADKMEYVMQAGLNLREYLPVTLFLGIVNVADGDKEGVDDGDAVGTRGEGGGRVSVLDEDGLVKMDGANEEETDSDKEGEEEGDNDGGLDIITGVPSKR